jgi:hypothetical protein
MKMKFDFISGFASALASLGIEGDNRGVDWSEAYKYLQSRLDTFEPEKSPADRVATAIANFIHAKVVTGKREDEAYQELVEALTALD